MKFLLYPLSIVYNLITSLRNLLFDLGLINSVQYKIPTIGVGNLSTGGTGKSILVDYLIELLKIKYSITTLSRGYNRDTSGFIQATSKSSAYEIGDEPYQFYSKHPEINVVVCEDRRKGMKLILNNLPNTEISIWDDVFQHRYVKPGLMLLTTTFKYPYYQDEVLPMFEDLGIDVLAVDDAPKAIEGETRNQRMVVIRFEDEKAFNDWYDSEEYNKIKPIRLANSNGEVHLLEETNLSF